MTTSKRSKLIFVLACTVATLMVAWLTKELTKLIVPGIEKSIADAELTDIYQQNNAKKLFSEDILIVEAPPSLNRERDSVRIQTAIQIEAIAKNGPKVIALDKYFKRQGSAYADSLLFNTLQKYDVVIGVAVDSTYKPVEPIAPYNRLSSGHIWFSDKNIGVIRYIKPFVGNYPCFAAKILEKYNPRQFAKIKEEYGENEKINYTVTQNRFSFIPYNDFVNGSYDKGLIKNKIVIISDTTVDRDYFTPLNEDLYVRTQYDMKGVFIQANILEMMLHNNHIYELPIGYILIVSFLVNFVLLLILLRFYHAHAVLHLLLKSIQIATAALFLIIQFVLLSTLNIFMEEKWIIFPMAISLDVLYICYWIYEKSQPKQNNETSH